MTLLALETFNGIAPAVHPSKLNDGMAVTAHNVRLDRGVLEPWADIDYVQDTGMGIKSLYIYQGDYIAHTSVRQYIGSMTPNDPYDFLYYTDADYPKIRSGSAEYKLGLPRPEAPTPSVVEPGDKSNITDVQSFRYVISIRDSWGHEGPSSPEPSTPVEVGKDFSVDLDLQSSTVTGNHNLGSGAVFYIYRSNSGSSSGVFQFLAAVPYGTASYTDTTPAADLDEALPSQQWVAAPDDDTTKYPAGPLASLIEVPGGILAGHSGNTVFFSEPYVPTAWPYYYADEAKVRGLAMIQGGVFCATDAEPYLLTGSHPSAMATVPIESNESCVSARGLVSLGGVAIYPSPNGLVLAQGNRADVVTQDYLDKEAWAEFQPDTIRAFPYEGKYLAFYGPVTDRKGFIFDPRGGRNTLVTFEGLGVDAGYYDVSTDTLHLAYLDTDGQWKIGKFNAGDLLDFTYRTRPVLYPDPVALSVLRVDADLYPVTLELFADGISRGSWDIPDAQTYRLPGGYRAKEYQVEVRGSGVVSGVYLSDSMGEIV